MKICIVSASPKLNSGFSVVAKNIAKGLKKLDHEIAYIGLQTAHTSEWCNGIEILPAQSFHIDDITQTMLTINKIKPDVVLAIIQMDADFNDFAKIFPKTAIYTPVEGRNIPQKMSNDLLSIKANGGEVVAQCRYGQEEIRLALAGIDIPYIYHGFDDKIFKPLDFKKDQINYCYYKTEYGKVNSDPMVLCKNACFDCQLSKSEEIKCPHYKEEQVAILKFINGKWTEGTMSITHLPIITKDKFVFLFVGQNLGVRKRIERLLKAYYLFIKDSKQLRDRTVLHLHAMPISVSGVNLIKIIQDLGIQNNIIFSYGSYRSSGWTDEAMCILYNTADVNVSASSSEGFCLPVLEGFATGIPMIAPNCSSFVELIGDGEKDPEKSRGLLANIGEWQMIENGSERALVNELHLSIMMKKMYQNEDLRNTFSKNSIKFAQNYTWDKICLIWDSLLKEIK
jgi:glycosyltransferase involved in cell wall biosynthesis